MKVPDLFTRKQTWLTILGLSGVETAALENQPWWVLACLAAITVAALIARGLADHGKEAAKVQADAVKALPG